MLEADDFLSTGDDERRVCGLDITIAWPLPIAPPAYEEFANKVAQLDSGIYIYPLKQTHITVLTAVDFKRELDPSESRVRKIEDAAEKLVSFLERLAATLRPFVIGIGKPVLSDRAAYLAIQNPSGEIERIRRAALEFCRDLGEPLAGAQAPTIIHSTILRFRRPPEDADRFMSWFRRVADDVRFGTGTIDDFAGHDRITNVYNARANTRLWPTLRLHADKLFRLLPLRPVRLCSEQKLAQQTLLPCRSGAKRSRYC